jgi:hypothetical protein
VATRLVASRVVLSSIELVIWLVGWFFIFLLGLMQLVASRSTDCATAAYDHVNTSFNYVATLTGLSAPPQRL